MEIPGRRGERLPRMKKTMFRRRWIVVITSMVLIAVTILLGYGPAVAYRYSGFTDTPKRALTPLVEPFLDDLEAAHLPLLLGHREPEERARRPTAGRRRRSPASRPSASASRRIRSASSAARSRAPQARERVLATLRFLATRRRARSAHGMTGYKGFFYHFLDMETGARFETSSCRRSTPRCCSRGVLFCAVVLRRRRSGRGEIRAPRRRALRARRLALGAAARAARSAIGWTPESGLPRLRLARLQRGDARLPARARLADPSGRRRGLGRSGRAPTTRLGHGPRAGAPRLRAAVRAPVLARLDRLPRHPGRLHARARHRLLRELAGAPRYAQRAYAIANPRRLARLRRRRLGPHRLRRAADVELVVDGGRRAFHTYAGARRRRRSVRRRRHARADRRRRSIAVRARDRRSRRCVAMRERYGEHIYGRVRLPRRVQSELHVRPCRCTHGASSPGVGWVDTDYLGIDQGADRGDDRELPQRPRLEA